MTSERALSILSAWIAEVAPGLRIIGTRSGRRHLIVYVENPAGVSRRIALSHGDPFQDRDKAVKRDLRQALRAAS